ncbi:pentatricopeptide repeat-containing protein At4g02750-like [Selaginella moellendorffii]|uniref:pentatricopeptide repeat-containing protein At4g02750-like n=1 Tax=Selaginella moellendorffii TaxID=88036 RepID=UPI000D1C2203|nr:pentatricopeptide repeat-containing protein At4g02750-like [Selaginella moellendorffii]|eukprot:XP_024514775.1 pentatricopeptide repeat-containing protein At4g02750-like [Selaginella moellendorffii]
MNGESSRALWQLRQLTRLVRSCGSSKNLAEARRLHARILRSEHRNTKFLNDQLVIMFGKCGSVDDARGVFSGIAEPDSISSNSMLAAYAQNGHLDEARAIFEGMTSRTVVSWNSTMSAYAQNRSLNDSKAMFDAMPETTYVSWNTIISAFAQTGHMEESKRLFDSMPERSEVSWNSLIAAYAHRGCAGEAMDCLERMPESSVVSWNSAMGAYIQAGELKGAVKIFKSMPERDSISCNAMLAAYAQSEQPTKAKKVFDRYKLGKSVVSWTSLLQANAMAGDLDEAEIVFLLMPQHDFISWTAVASAFGSNGCLEQLEASLNGSSSAEKEGAQTAMVGGYAQCGQTENAKSIFDTMPARTILSWSNLLSGYAQRGRSSDARMVFAKMPIHEVLSSTVVISSLAQRGEALEARAIFDGMVEHSDITWNSILSAYVAQGDVEQSKRVFESIPERGIVSWTGILQAYAETGDLALANMTYDRMPEQDVISCTTLVQAYAQTAHLSRAKELFLAMPRRDRLSWVAILTGFSCQRDVNSAKLAFDRMPEQDEVSCSAMIAAYAENGHLVEAEILLRSKPNQQILSWTAIITAYAQQGFVSKAKETFERLKNVKDVMLWTAMIVVYARNGHCREAVVTFETMTQEGMRPDEVCFVTILTACSHGGLLDESRMFFRSLRDFGIQATNQHYLCMIDILGRLGHLDRVEELLHTMPFVPDEEGWGGFLGACKMYGDLDRADQVARRTPGLNAASHVSLRNMLGIAGRTEDAAAVRKKMVSSGLSKQPGISLIIVNSEMHSFTSGDESHPRIHEIRAELQRLTSQMRESGYVPDTHDVFHAVSEAGKSELVWHHSEKLAIAFGLISTSPGVPLWIRKNLRVCLDCHSATKFISKVTGRSIVVRDSYRFHKFENGSCSCGDFW